MADWEQKLEVIAKVFSLPSHYAHRIRVSGVGDLPSLLAVMTLTASLLVRNGENKKRKRSIP